MKPDIGNAIKALGYKANFGIKDGKITDWDISQSNKTVETQPLDDVINNKLKELQVEYDAQEYARARQSLYPAIGDQLDDLYHAGAFSKKMTATIKKVKKDNPK